MALSRVTSPVTCDSSPAVCLVVADFCTSDKRNGMPLVSRRTEILATSNRAAELKTVFCLNTSYYGQVHMGVSLDLALGGVFNKENKHTLDVLRGKVFGLLVVVE
jgi:hypothetical protein